ncbi:MAG TPA: VWA domain-containing protein [Pyrinomonadaceae bacterium]|nr:VWA domain-containing protein [Pyrinomonadaceae bacterium]
MRKPTYLSLGIAVGLLLLAKPAVGQSNPPQEDERVIVGTHLVTVNVIVTDNNGRYVKGLTRDRFAVYDDTVKQEIAHFSAGSSPVSLGIICEIHETATERLEAMLAAIKQFAGTLGNRDDFFFVAFSRHGSLTSAFIPSAQQVLDHLQYVKPGGPSSLYDAVYVAADRLQKARNLKKALLVISDGQDSQSRYTYKELRDRLRAFDAQIYAIGIADSTIDQFAGYGRWVFEDITRKTGRRSFLLNSEAALGRAVLAEMSRASGGAAYFPETESEPELAGICTQIALELREQYTLGFYSKVTGRKWHQLRVNVKERAGSSRPTLSYREGYQHSRN